MGRLRYLTRADLDEDERGIFDRLERERSLPTDNIFRALAHAPRLLDAFLSYANAVRHESRIDPLLRELAILIVGVSTDCEYEVSHHRSHALKAGLSQAQFDAVPQFEGSPLFDARQKAVMRFAQELTVGAKVSEATWREVRGRLSDQEMVGLILNVGWYNSAVRFMNAIEIDDE